jgi:hypothetical protein
MDWRLFAVVLLERQVRSKRVVGRRRTFLCDDRSVRTTIAFVRCSDNGRTDLSIGCFQNCGQKTSG